MKITTNIFLACLAVFTGNVAMFAQSFTGAEFGNQADEYEAENAEAASGLDNATPSNDVNEFGDYGAESGDYGNAVGNYGLGSEPTNDKSAGESNYGNYGNYGSETGNAGNIFDSQYENYQQSLPASPAVSNPTVTNPAVTNPGESVNNYPANNGAYNPVPQQPVNPILMNPVAAESVAPVQNALPPTTVPSASVPAVEDGSLYYPTDAQPVVPVAPPLPPPNEFSGAPPVPGSMRYMAAGEAPEEYVVEPGDTLFDVCDQLLDEPAYWPKLWALNPEIKNPHFIYPGMKLRFYPGDEESPPYLQVVAEEDVIPIDKGELDESQLILEPIQFVTEEFADPDPVEVIGSDQVTVDDDIVMSGGSYAVPPVQVRIPGFIYPEEKVALGYVHLGRQGEAAAMASTRVFFEQASGLSTGSSYSVLRYGREVENPETGDFVGHLYYWVGDVKIERTVGDDYATGLVIEARVNARQGDILVEYVSTNRQTTTDYTVAGLSSVNANVVGFGEETGQLGGQGQFAFIDSGSGGGVSPGMHIPIYATPRSFLSGNIEMGLPIDYEQVGVIRILDATPAGAVGLIVQSSDAIRMGDRTDKG